MGREALTRLPPRQQRVRRPRFAPDAYRIRAPARDRRNYARDRRLQLLAPATTTGLSRTAPSATAEVRNTPSNDRTGLGQYSGMFPEVEARAEEA